MGFLDDRGNRNSHRSGSVRRQALKGRDRAGHLSPILHSGDTDRHHVTAVVPAFLITSFAGFSDSLPARHKFSEDFALINFADGDPDDLVE